MPANWMRCLRLLVLAAVCFALVTGHPTKRAQTPDTDPFYLPPAGFENQAPGTILRTRTIVAAFLGLVPAVDVTTYQLLFRTTAIDGSAIAEVTTVFRPKNATNDRFVSFQTAYDGSATICDPSYGYQLLSEQVGLIASAEFLFVEIYLASGYIVSSSDYESSNAAFGAGRLAGMGVLDSMRAVSNFHGTLNLTSATPKVVGYGYSGGAIATGWAASLHNSYAPELPVLAWAQGGTPANLTGTALFLDDTAFSGFVPAAVSGLIKPSAYGATLGPKIESVITPYGQSVLNFTDQNCIADLVNFPEMSFLDTKVQSLGDQLFYDPVVASVLERTVMGISANETPTVPVYVYHATNDEIIPYANATTLVNAWCGYGASVDFVTYANGGHITTEIFGFASAFQYVQAAFNGTVPKSGCTASTSYNNTLDPLVLGVSLEPILTRLVDVLAKLGRGDSNVVSDPGTLNDTVST